MNLSKYFEFEGVINRSQYWAILVLSFLLYLGSVFVGAMAWSFIYILLGFSLENFDELVKIIYVPLFLVLAWIWLAAGAKRCRDMDVSPLWLILWCLPWVGFFTVILFGVLPSKDVAVAEK